MTWTWTLLSALTIAVATAVLRGRAHVIAEHQRGLLFRNGRFVREVGAGLVRLRHPHSTLEVFDLRPHTAQLAPQEVSTVDRVSVKASVVVTYRVAEPRVARAAHADYAAELYRRAQLALRAAVAHRELDELVPDHGAASQELAQRLSADAADLGLVVESAAVLDVIVRAELKRALAEVVQSRAEARAKLERARGESAALRNLTNAARLLRDHEGLYQLRLLETAQTAAQSEKNSLFLGLREQDLSRGERGT